MKRRALLLAAGSWLAFAGTHSIAQAPASARRVGALFPGSQSGFRTRFEALRAKLKELGYVEGSNLLIEARFADNRMELLDDYARQLVALNPAVILTGSSAGVIACMKATSRIPIVFGTAGNPVEQGFVASLRHPGGNVTGVMVHSAMHAKIVEVAREALPKAKRLALLAYESDPFQKSAREAFVAAAKAARLEPIVVPVRGVEDLALAFKEVLSKKPDALLLPGITFMSSNSAYLIERSLEARLPLITGYDDATERGGLLSYGTDRNENYRRAAVLVDKILRGAKPGDLPVEQPERFELIVNMKTANAIGVTLSPAILLRATKVIE
jgi:putative ABC transport system substrate-binding protein